MAEVMHFDKKHWDLDFRAELYKEEFFASDAWAAAQNEMLRAWDSSTTEELQSLRELKKKERPGHIGEIEREQQGAVMIGCWFDLLKIDPTSHPITTELLHATIYLAGSVATAFKARFNRARPSVLAPDLSPPIPVPGLPSYPGGHATQMYLMAETLRYLIPDKEADIMAIAKEVSVNRERAGLNYPSDTKAGQQLARQVFKLLERKCPMFKSVLDDAKDGEWERSLR